MLVNHWSTTHFYSFILLWYNTILVHYLKLFLNLININNFQDLNVILLTYWNAIKVFDVQGRHSFFQLKNLNLKNPFAKKKVL